MPRARGRALVALTGALASGALVLDRGRSWPEPAPRAAGAAGHRTLDGRRRRPARARAAGRPARHRPRRTPPARGARGHRPGRLGTVPELRDRAPLAAVRLTARARAGRPTRRRWGRAASRGWRAASPSWVMPFQRPPTMSPADEGRAHGRGRQCADPVGQGAAGVASGDDLEDLEAGVAQEEDRPVGLVQRAVQPERVGAGVLLGRGQVEREVEARDLPAIPMARSSRCRSAGTSSSPASTGPTGLGVEGRRLRRRGELAALRLDLGRAPGPRRRP